MKRLSKETTVTAQIGTKLRYEFSHQNGTYAFKVDCLNSGEAEEIEEMDNVRISGCEEVPHMEFMSIEDAVRNNLPFSII